MKFAGWIRSAFRGSKQMSIRSGYRPRLEILEARNVLAVAFVTSDADAGPGSFRDAVDQANSTTGNGERGINLDEAGTGSLLTRLKRILSSNPVADDLT